MDRGGFLNLHFLCFHGVLTACLVFSFQNLFGQDDPPVSFEAEDPGPQARMLLRSFGASRVFLNDVPVPDPDRETANWKRFRRLEIAPLVRRGLNAVRVEVAQTYALADTAAAHRDLEARRTVGSTVLLP